MSTAQNYSQDFAAETYVEQQQIWLEAFFVVFVLFGAVLPSQCPESTVLTERSGRPDGHVGLGWLEIVARQYQTQGSICLSGRL